MQWIAPSEKDGATESLEKSLWDARSEEFRGVAIKSMSGASGRQRAQEQCFDDFQISQPPRALLDRFSPFVSPSFRLIYKLHLIIQNLRRTRDLLLPRLLSGHVEFTL